MQQLQLPVCGGSTTINVTVTAATVTITPTPGHVLFRFLASPGATYVGSSMAILLWRQF